MKNGNLVVSNLQNELDALTRWSNPGFMILLRHLQNPSSEMSPFRRLPLYPQGRSYRTHFQRVFFSECAPTNHHMPHPRRASKIRSDDTRLYLILPIFCRSRHPKFTSFFASPHGYVFYGLSVQRRVIKLFFGLGVHHRYDIEAKALVEEQNPRPHDESTLEWRKCQPQGKWKPTDTRFRNCSV